MSRNPALFVGATLVALLTCAGLLGPLIDRRDPLGIDLSLVLASPDFTHPLGCDALGRDVLARLIHGARLSLSIAVSVVCVTAPIGSILGAAAATLGGAVDVAVMGVVDIVLAFPGIILALALAAILGPGIPDLIIALAAVGWTGYARLARGEVLSLRERDYVLATRALGGSTARLVFRHLIPSVLPAILVRATYGISGLIVAESALSFLGLGAPLPTPTWGNMLDEGRAFLLVAPHLAIAPAAAIGLAALGFNFLGDGLATALSPHDHD